jgi:hypothetical protein
MVVRRRQRVRMNGTAPLVIEGSGGEILVRARFLDMSEDGVAILAGVELPIDSVVHFECSPMFNEGPVRVPAVVRTRRQYIYGLEFLPRDGEEEQKLRTLKAMLISTGTPAPGRLGDRRRT